MRRHQLAARWSVPDPVAAAGRNLLVLLHGYGTDEQRLYDQVTSAVNADVVIVSLRGPIAEGGGYAWVPMEISLATSTPDAVAAVARERAEPVLEWLDMLPPTHSIGLLGVSQGAVVALHLLRLAPTRFSYAINLSGYVLAGEEVGDAALQRQPLPVFWGRGRRDQVIPPSYVKRTAEWLPLHSTLISRVYPLGHEESPEEFADVATFVRAVIHSSPSATSPARRGAP